VWGGNGYYTCAVKRSQQPSDPCFCSFINLS
jgi:hypothetical protein